MKFFPEKFDRFYLLISVGFLLLGVSAYQFYQHGAVHVAVGGNQLAAVAAVPVDWPPAYMANLPVDYILRVKAQLQNQVDVPFPSPTDSTPESANFGRLNYAIAALTLQENTAKANAYLELVQINPIDPGTADSLQLATLVRAYMLFNSKSIYMPGRLSAAAQAHLEDIMWAFVSHFSTYSSTQSPAAPWEFNGSENHHLQETHIYFLVSQIFKDFPAATLTSRFGTSVYNDGRTPKAHYDAWKVYFSDYLDELAKRGLFTETASTYERYTMPVIFNLYNFPQDAGIKKKAEMILDLFFADFGQEQFQYVRGGGKSRIYLNDPARLIKSTVLLPWTMDSYRYGWLLFGPVQALVAPAPPGNVNTVAALTTSAYYPPPVVQDLAENTEARGVYSITARRPGVSLGGYESGGISTTKSVLKYSFVGQQYIIGAFLPAPGVIYDQASRQNRWAGITYNGDVSARIFPALGTTKEQINYDSFFALQDKNILIMQKNPSVSYYPIDNPATHIYFSSSLDLLTEEGGWLFVKEGLSYTAVKVVSGGYHWLTADKNKSPDAASNYLVLNDPNSPMIYIVNDASDYKNNFNAFKASIKLQPITYTGGTLTFLNLSFNTSRLGMIDGTMITTAPSRVFDSPFIRSTFGSGLVYIRSGSDSEILDFRNTANPIKTVSATIDTSFPAGVGTEKPTVILSSCALTAPETAITGTKAKFSWVTTTGTSTKGMITQGSTVVAHVELHPNNMASITMPTVAGKYTYILSLRGVAGNVTCTQDVLVTAGAVTPTPTPTPVPTTPTTLSAPTATPAAGTYSTAAAVTLRALSGALIRYTTNGTTPSCAVGTLYSSPLVIAKTTTIKAIACPASTASIRSKSLFSTIYKALQNVLATVVLSITGGTTSPSPVVTFVYVITPTPTPVPSTKFSIGNTVQTTSTLNIRATPSTSGTLLGTQAVGAIGTVVGGPISANGFNWWNINYNTGVDGWSVEDYLVKVTPPTSDTQPPRVTLTSPVQNASLEGFVTLSATATDNVGVISVQFYFDADRLGPAITTAPYRMDWATSPAVSGSHTITAVARDARGNESRSSADIQITSTVYDDSGGRGSI